MLQGLCARDTSMEHGSHFLRSSSVRMQGWFLQLVFAEVSKQDDMTQFRTI